MADPHLLTESSGTQNAAPLLNNTVQSQAQKQEDPEEFCDTHLDKALQRLELFLSLLGFNQSSVSSFGLSWVAFMLIGVAIPVVVLKVSNCSGCDEYQILEFELEIVASLAGLAAVSLLCISHNLRKYGVRKFLFVDRYSGQMVRFSDDYIQKIRDSVRMLVLWLIPCFILKTAREVTRILYVPHEPWWLSIAILLALIISWTYVTTIYLSACIVFHLVCNLQIIHFADYGKSLEREPDIMLLIEDHVRLRHHLSKISHRFRIYLLLVFLVVTASLFVTLFQTTAYSGFVTLINGGDLAVSSMVQLVGIILCLNAAAKISHRAQGIASLASRWHATATCSSGDASRLRVTRSVGNLGTATCSSGDASHLRVSNSAGNFGAPNLLGSLYINNSESDLESLEYMEISTRTHLASDKSSYHKRQSFVMYLQMNPGGITIFGLTVDRGLINTIFFIELSLVLFVLGKTIINV